VKYNRIGSGGTKVKGKRAAAILFTDGKAILLLKRSGEGDHVGSWCLPGGKSKEGETEIGNAIRETKEETGLDSIPGFRFDSMTSRNGRQKFTTFFYKVNQPFDVNLSKEHSEWNWINFEDLDKTKLHPKLEEAVPECLRIIRKKTGSSFEEWSRVERIVQLFSERSSQIDLHNNDSL
jgi:8-oxo-dGTP pyrophosphatase MutT (NUDIX family)